MLKHMVVDGSDCRVSNLKYRGKVIRIPSAQILLYVFLV